MRRFFGKGISNYNFKSRVLLNYSEIFKKSLTIPLSLVYTTLVMAGRRSYIKILLVFFPEAINEYAEFTIRVNKEPGWTSAVDYSKPLFQCVIKKTAVNIQTNSTHLIEELNIKYSLGYKYLADDNVDYPEQTLQTFKRTSIESEKMINLLKSAIYQTIHTWVKSLFNPVTVVYTAIASIRLSIVNHFFEITSNIIWAYKFVIPQKFILQSNILDLLISGYSVKGNFYVCYKIDGEYFTISDYFYSIIFCEEGDTFEDFSSKHYSFIDDERRATWAPNPGRAMHFNHYSIEFAVYPTVFLKKELTHKMLPTSDDILETFVRFFAVLYSFFKKVLVAALVGLLFIVFSFYAFQLSFLKVTANWIFILLFAYWLFSGFNFFLKRYRLGKFTSAIQRFWKRAFMCFWMIEGFLFLLFFYYLLNSSSEPIFMYDQIALYTEQLLSWKTFLFNSMLTVVAINLVQIFLLSSKNKVNKTAYIIIFIITLFLLVVLLTESYQFYYIVNFYDEAIWVFSEEDNIWELEHDTPRTRTKNHYLTLCILAKFWHYIFIFLVWVFCLMKFFETGRISYNLISINYQNLIIFYLMSWIFMFSWLKWFSRRFLDNQYYWFFTSNRNWHYKILINDIAICIIKFINYCVVSPFNFMKTNYNTIFFYIKLINNNNYTRESLLRNYFIQKILV